MLKRVLSLLLTVAMVMTMVPVQVFAEEENKLEQIVDEVAAETTALTEAELEVVEEIVATTEVMSEPVQETTASTETVEEPTEENTVPSEEAEPTEAIIATTEPAVEPIEKVTVLENAVTSLPMMEQTMGAAERLPNQTITIPDVDASEKKPDTYPVAVTADDVEAIVMDYWSTVTRDGDAYWNAHIRAQNEVRNSGILTAITRDACKGNTHDTGVNCSKKTLLDKSECTYACTSNADYRGNYYETQCEGFVWYMIYTVFKADRKAEDRIHGNDLLTYQVKAGDHIRWPTSTHHSQFVYKVEGSTAYVIECNNPSGSCKINLTEVDWKSKLEEMAKDSGSYVEPSTLKSFTIKFDANKPSDAQNLTGSMENQIANIGSSIQLSANAYAIENYEFQGWNTAPDGSGSSYRDQDSVTNLSQTDGETVTLYAQWKALGPVTLAEGVLSNGVHWSIKDTGYMSLWVDPSEMDYNTPVEIPDFASPEERPWHDYRGKIEEVRFFGNLVGVGNYAFYECRKIHDAFLFNDQISRVGDYAFYNCKSLLQFNGCTTIGKAAFAGCEDLQFSIFSNFATRKVKYIDDEAFAGCTGFDQDAYYKMSDALTHIGERAFADCTAMKVIYLPASVTHIGEGVFEGCTKLERIELESSSATFSAGQSLINKKTKTLLAYCLNAKDYPVIPTTIQRIGDGAFRYYNFQSQQSITIPGNVTSIGDRAFANARYLYEIYFEGDAPEFGKGCFGGVSARAYYPEGNETWTEEVLQSSIGVLVWYPHKVEIIKDSGSCSADVTWTLDTVGILTIAGVGDMPNYSSGTMPWYKYRWEIKKVVIKNGITGIGDNAFGYEFDKLQKVSIAGSVTKIGENAFGDSGLTEVKIPESVTVIGDAAFTNCTNLETLTIKGAVTIGDSAFFNCNSLTKITIPASAATVGMGAFYSCDNLEEVTILAGGSINQAAFAENYALKKVYFKGDPPVIAADAFANVIATAYYPKNDPAWSTDIRQNYGGALTWEADQVEVVGSGICGEGVYWLLDSDGALTISGNGNMQDFSGSNQAPWYADRDLITMVSILDGVTSIGAEAFVQCTALKDVTIGQGVKAIGEAAFSGCSALPEVSIPQTVTTIGDQAFAGCSSLPGIDVPASVVSIGSGAFSDCSSLTEALLSKNAVTIGDSVFSGCSKLRDIYYDAAEGTWKSLWTDSGKQSDWIGYVTVHCSKLWIYADKVNLSINRGEEVCLSACLVVNQARIDTSGITFQIADTSVLRVNDTGTKDSALYVELEGLAEGSTTVTFSDSDTGSMAIVPITVCEREKNTYTLAGVPEREIKGTVNNFYGFNGLYIDSLSYSQDHAGVATVTFDAYNSNNSYAVVEVYTENGVLDSYVLIEKASEYSTSLKEYIWDNTGLLIGDALDGDLFCYRMEWGYNKHTHVSIKIPKNGYFKITSDPNCSAIVKNVNDIDVVFATAELSGKLVGYLDNREPFLEDAVKEATKKGIKSTAKTLIKDTAVTEASMTDYLTGVCQKLSDTEFEKLILDKSAEFGFEIGESVLDLVPCFGGAFKIIFSVGEGANILHQLISLRDCQDTGAIVIQNQIENFRTNNKVVVQSETDFPEDVALNVFEVALDDGLLGTLKEKLPDVHEAITEGKTYTYNISLLKNKNEVQPDGKVTVYIPIPEDLKTLAYLGQTNIYRVEEDGTVTNMAARIENGCFVFDTDHFSLYILSGYDSGETPENIVASGTCGENLTWTLSDEGTLTISGTGEMADFYDGSGGYGIPWNSYRQNITKVDIQYGVTSISAMVFALGNGHDIEFNIPESVKTLGKWCFESCNFTSISLPEGIATIPEHAFLNCRSLMDIEIPSSITRIEDSAFQNCDSLVSIVIPEKVDYLGASVFFDCDVLESVTFCGDAPEIATEYVGAIFDRDMTAYYPGNNETWNAETLRDYSYGTTTWIAYGPPATSGACGDNVTWAYNGGILTISGSGDMYHYISGTAPWAVYANEIISVQVEPGVTNVGEGAFSGMTMMNQVALPETVTNIAYAAFHNCTSLQEVTIPDNVITISYNAFENCTGLQSVNLPEKVTEIAYAAFHNCTSLQEIMIPDNVTTISYNAFENCSNLQSVSLPAAVTDICYNAFAECTSLARVDFPEMLESIEDRAYKDCSNLRDLYFTGNAPVFGSTAFAGVTATANYPGNNLTWTADVTQNYGGELTWIPYGPAPGGQCGENLFWSFDRESGTMRITGTGTMWDYEVGYTPWETFIDQITSIVVETGTLSIGQDAFWGCDTLRTVTLPDGLLSIGRSAFLACSQLSNVVLPDSLTTIGETAFKQCFNLQEIVIPAGVKNIEQSSFAICTSLTGILVDADNPYYCNDEFGVLFNRDRSQLIQAPGMLSGAYSIPETVKSVAFGAFDHCLNLTEIVIPANVEQIGTSVFTNCAALTSIYFKGDAPQLSFDCFEFVTATAYYPAGNASWTQDVFQNYGGNIVWQPYGIVENRISVSASDLNGQTTVWIDGAAYSVKTEGDYSFIDLPDSNARTMVTYTYNVDNGSSMTQYPVGMKVWMLSNTDGVYSVDRTEVMDNLLQYSGMSIRVTGKKGIRMITSIDQSKKAALVSGGLAGYSLKEYGTVVAWASQLSDTNPLILGKPYVKSNYAYKKGVADPVFNYTSNLMQYTNVLVNFSDEQCKNEIAMRAYMILEDAQGEQLILYGGIVKRSIGYIAYQNRKTFEPQTEEYNYIWGIIHYVYGDVYDDEFVHSWTEPYM